jgi:hypothetical protein
MTVVMPPCAAPEASRENGVEEGSVQDVKRRRKEEAQKEEPQVEAWRKNLRCSSAYLPRCSSSTINWAIRAR